MKPSVKPLYLRLSTLLIFIFLCVLFITFLKLHKSASSIASITSANLIPTLSTSTPKTKPTTLFNSAMSAAQQYLNTEPTSTTKTRRPISKFSLPSEIKLPICDYRLENKTSKPFISYICFGKSLNVIFF